LTLRFKVFDFGPLEGDVGSMIEALGIKAEVLKPTEIHVHTMSQRIPPNQVLVINQLYHPQPKEVFQAIAQFVFEGGRLFIFNSASHLISAIFPGKIGPSPPSTLTTGRVRFPGPDKDLFTSWPQDAEVDVEYNRYPFSVIDREGVKVLAEVKGRHIEPTVGHFTHGNGGVWVFVSRMLLHERKKGDLVPRDASAKAEEAKVKAEVPAGEQESDEKKSGHQAFQTKKRKLPAAPAPKKGPPEIPPDFDTYLAEKGASHDTIIAWRCAVNVGWTEAYNMAKRALPPLEMLAKLIIREQATLDSMFPQEEQNVFLQAPAHPNIKQENEGSGDAETPLDLNDEAE